MSRAKTISPRLQGTDVNGADRADWDAVNATIQTILGGLDVAVASICRTVRVTSGRNFTPAWDLFSYRVYRSSEHPQVDPVVVGITCKSTAVSFVITGDIAGESLGDVLFEAPAGKAVGNADLLNVAPQIAWVLAKQSAIVAAAILDDRRHAN